MTHKIFFLHLITVLFMAANLLHSGCSFGDGDAMDSYRQTGDPLFVAVQAGNDVYSSKCGHAWQWISSSPLASTDTIEYGSGIYVIAGGFSGNGGFSVSLNCVEWETPAHYPEQISSIAYNDGIFTAGDASGDNSYSFNGRDWFEGTGNLHSNPIYSISYGGDIFISMGNGQVQTSINGINWSGNVWDQGLINIYGSAYGNTVFAITGGDPGFSNGFISVSQNGVSFTENLLAPGAPAVFNITFGGRRFVAVGENGTVYISENGFNWTGPVSVPGSAGNNLNSVIYGNGLFVAAGDNGTIVTSEDGYTWSPNLGPGTGNFKDVAYRP